MPPAVQTDRGWAWVVLAASMANNFLTGALCFSIGVIHVGLLRKYKESVTVTAWVGGLFSSLGAILAPIASFIIGRFGCRVCCVLGGLFFFVGFSASAFATSIGQLYITYGLIAGLGLGLVHPPTNVTVSYYFDKFRGLAAGLSWAMMAVGVLAGNLIMQALLDEYSVSGAFLLAGALSLHYSLFGMFFRPTAYESGEFDLDDTAVEKEVCFGSVMSLAAHSVVIKHAASTEIAGYGGDKRHGETSTIPLLMTTAVNGEYHSTCVYGSREQSLCSHRSEGGLTISESVRDNSRDAHRAEEDDAIRDDGEDEAVLKYKPNGEAQAGYVNSDSLAELDTCDILKNSPGTNSVVQNNTLDNADGCENRGGDQALGSKLDIPEISVSKPTTNAAHARTTSKNRRGIVSNVKAYKAILSDAAFVCYCGSLLASNVGQSGVYLHLPEYTQTLGTSPVQAAALFVAIGLSSLLSRLAAGFATTDERIDPITINMGLCGLCGLVTALFPAYAETYEVVQFVCLCVPETYEGQLAYSALFGLYTGGLQALTTSLVVQFVGVSAFNTAFSVVNISLGIGFISGPPLAALVVDNGGTYEQSFILLGCMLEVAFFLNLGAGLFLKSTGKAAVDEGAVEDRDLMGSTLVISRTHLAVSEAPQ